MQWVYLSLFIIISVVGLVAFDHWALDALPRRSQRATARQTGPSPAPAPTPRAVEDEDEETPHRRAA